MTYLNKKKFFNKYGYLIQRNFFDKKLIEDCYRSISREEKSIIKLIKKGTLSKENYAYEKNSLKYLKNVNFYVKTLNKLIKKKLFCIVDEISIKNYYLNFVELHKKKSGGSRTPPHQDRFFFCLKTGHALTAYLALNKQNTKNGILNYISGSHKKNFKHVRSDEIGFSAQIDEKEFDKYKKKIIRTHLNPGDLMIHDYNLVHFADQNKSKKARVNLAFRFMSQDFELDKKKINIWKELFKSSKRR